MDSEQFNNYAQEYRMKLDTELRGKCYVYFHKIDEAVPRYHFSLKCRDKPIVTYVLFLNDGVPDWSML